VTANAPHHAVDETRIVASESAFHRAWLRGRTDVPFWSEYFLGIRLNPKQRYFARAATLLDPDGWHILLRNIVVSAGNRAGKTLALAVVILHHCFYKTGLRPADQNDRKSIDRWNRAPYNWFHLSHRQPVARHVYRELCLIAAGDHPAQVDKETGISRGCPLTAMFPGILETDAVEDKLYEWIKIAPAFGGAQLHFRNTDEKAKAILGLDMNGISEDEAASEPYLDDVHSNVLEARRGTTGGPIYSISTPDFNDFQFPDLWESGNPEAEERAAKTLSIRMSTRDNVDYGMTQHELDDLMAGKPAWWIDQHIDGKFVQAQDAYFDASAVMAAFIHGMPEEQEVKKGHPYVQGCDVGVAKDPSCTIILDTKGEVLIGVRISELPSPAATAAVVNLARAGSLLYGQGQACRCATILDASGMGGMMFLEEFQRAVFPTYAFSFSGRADKKIDLLGDLKTMLDNRRLRLPYGGVLWTKLRRQLLGYRLKDDKIAQDLVMTLALAVYHALRNGGDIAETNELDYWTAEG
jgi:hypothetical protein